MYDAVILDYRSSHDNGCKLRVVGSWYSMTSYGIGLPKGSKYKEIFNKHIIDYLHSGELERARNFWFSGSCKENNDEMHNDSHQFGLLQSFSVFILLLTGIVIGCILLIAHNIYNKYLRKTFNNIWIYEPRTKNGINNNNNNKTKVNEESQS